MEIRRACRESPQSRRFEASEITPEPGDVAPTGVSQLSDLTGSFVAKSIKPKIRGPHLGGGGFDVEQEIISVRSIVRRVLTTTTPASTRIRVIEQLLRARDLRPARMHHYPAETLACSMLGFSLTLAGY